MALAIIPLSVMLMSAATNTYAKAATGVANGKSNEKDNSKKMSDKDLLAAAKSNSKLFVWILQRITWVC